MMTTSAQTKEDIVKTLGENHAQLRALGVKRLGLCGSFVRGEQLWTSVLLCFVGVSSAAGGDEIRLERDDTFIRTATKVAPGQYRIIDAEDDGAIIIRGFDIVVDFQGAELIGAKEGVPPDQFSGTGVVVRGFGVTIRNLKVRGYKVGIHAGRCLDLVIEDVDVSGNFRQRLKSTPQREDGGDWMYPHRNDNYEWLNNYGAGLYIERSDHPTVRRVRARDGQNGIVLAFVNDGKIYDNDCSFLSGWGLAMWHCNSNIISRNAFDFCVRGYSHGVYNRGQDSAGILMFEQNSNNIIAENSATHGGDGFFGFGGRQALGQVWMDAQRERLRKEHGRDDVDDLIEVTDNEIKLYTRRGNNDNLLIGNDFSFAAAHGIEMTFSFGNKFIRNRLVGNAICGVWGGYSQDTLIAHNIIEDNGEFGYGLERGGINIEHGRGNVIAQNKFKNNNCGVHLWWDNDAGLLKTPWAKANHKGSTDNVIAQNTFDGDGVGLHLRETTNTRFVGNKMTGVKKEIDADAKSKAVKEGDPPDVPTKFDYTALGEKRPVGARQHLRGREKIIMTEWGPYDYESYLLTPGKVTGGRSATLRVLGPKGDFKVTKLTGDIEVSPKVGSLPGRIEIIAKNPGIHPFKLEIEAGGKRLQAGGTLVNADWNVAFYKWEKDLDPRSAEDNWTKIISAKPVDQRTVAAIDFAWAGDAPNEKVPRDHFATVATTRLTVPAGSNGKWRIETVSDDGVRVLIDGKKVLENWTWHGPTKDESIVELKAGAHDIRIEHFEIDGYAQLQFTISVAPVSNR